MAGEFDFLPVTSPLNSMYSGIERGQGFRLKDLQNQTQELQNVQTEAEMPWEIAQKAAQVRTTDLSNTKNAGTLDTDIAAGNSKNNTQIMKDLAEINKIPDQMFIDTINQTRQKSSAQIDAMLQMLQQGQSVQQVGQQLQQLIESSPMEDAQKQKSMQQLQQLVQQYGNNPQAAVAALQAAKVKLAQQQVDITPEYIQKMREIMAENAGRLKVAQTAADGKESKNENFQAAASRISRNIALISEQLKDPRLPKEQKAQLEAELRAAQFELQVQLKGVTQTQGITGTDFSTSKSTQVPTYGTGNEPAAPPPGWVRGEDGVIRKAK